MDNRSDSQRPWIHTLNRAGWGPISDRLIHGLGHNFAGRASSLAGLIYLLESGDREDASILSYLNQEVEKFEETIRLLRLLPDDSDGTEVLAPREILGDLGILVRTQRGLENVSVSLDIPADTPAVRANKTLFLRAILLLFTGAAEESLAQGHKKVDIRTGGEESALRLYVHPYPGSNSDESGGDQDVSLPRRVLPKRRLEIVREALAEEGIHTEEVEGSEVGTGIQLVFPPPARF